MFDAKMYKIKSIFNNRLKMAVFKSISSESHVLLLFAVFEGNLPKIS